MAFSYSSQEFAVVPPEVQQAYMAYRSKFPSSIDQSRFRPASTPDNAVESLPLSVRSLQNYAKVSGGVLLLIYHLLAFVLRLIWNLIVSPLFWYLTLPISVIFLLQQALPAFWPVACELWQHFKQSRLAQQMSALLRRSIQLLRRQYHYYRYNYIFDGAWLYWQRAIHSIERRPVAIALLVFALWLFNRRLCNAIWVRGASSVFVKLADLRDFGPQFEVPAWMPVGDPPGSCLCHN